MCCMPARPDEKLMSFCGPSQHFVRYEGQLCDDLFDEPTPYLFVRVPLRTAMHFGL